MFKLKLEGGAVVWVRGEGGDSYRPDLGTGLQSGQEASRMGVCYLIWNQKVRLSMCVVANVGLGVCVGGGLQQWLEMLGDFSWACGLGLLSKIGALHHPGHGCSLAQGTQELQPILGTGGP